MAVVAKKQIAKDKIVREHGCMVSNGFVCPKCVVYHRIIDKMCDSNIPAGYWFLTMKKFKGAPKLKEIYDNYVENLHDKYENGRSVCFVGNQGVGKTMLSICILKEAIKNNFSVYYTTAADILNELAGSNNYGLRNILKTVDFLVIDELDSRFFTSDSAKELFSSIYENIFRSRAQNMMPTILCTNETDDLLNVFYGMATQSILSLNSQYLDVYPVIGKDFRKTGVVNAK